MFTKAGTTYWMYLSKFSLIIGLSFLFGWNLLGQHAFAPNHLDWFTSFLYDGNEDEKEKIIDKLETNWIAGYAPFVVELLRFTNDANENALLKRLLVDKMGWSNRQNYFDHIQKLWESDPYYPYYYFDFKAELYKHIDPRFEKYFAGRYEQASIRLDEVVWGGVQQDGIPPLRFPETILADQADFLGADDIIFGVYINGEARAYPKRILGWHEMAIDEVGGQSIALVYCTLCGTGIAYNLVHNDIHYNLGTSGFLYRSNKLMYDQKTQSLWNTIEGVPVIGPLVNQGIKLQTYSVYTTTWRNWKMQHPNTRVLSLETGHDRDYSEGAAYRSYFGTDDLMFPVAFVSETIPNKEEVFVLRPEGFDSDPLAITRKYLDKHAIVYEQVADQAFVIITLNNTPPRAFQISNERFVKIKKEGVIDDKGQVWELTEEGLSHRNQLLPEIPAHQIFWFGWYAQFPSTRLIK